MACNHLSSNNGLELHVVVMSPSIIVALLLMLSVVITHACNQTKLDVF